ncbi:redoxin domain-containing protein [Halobaculum litoreum]|uniref:redoxin domain-containing protein n=1 Tax=Halobaculum litoreum TaxID=3031998 RepID=UPI0024C3E76A|nr:redoxin domain-containing protein [Halobaculum sp. DT92]
MVDFDVVELPEADHVDVGDEAPDFTRPLVGDEYWRDAALSDIDGPVALVFFTMDGAFPATYMWNEIRDRGWGTDDDLTVVGVSISTPYEHKRFVEERGMEYELFSDPSAAVGDLYGAVQDLDGMTGIREHRPAVFLLDDDHAVEYAWVASEWPEFPDYDEVEAHLDRL